VSCAKTADPIEMPFAVWTRVCPREHVLDGGAHWRYLPNTIKPPMCGDDAALLTNYFDHHLFKKFNDRVGLGCVRDLLIGSGRVSGLDRVVSV